MAHPKDQSRSIVLQVAVSKVVGEKLQEWAMKTGKSTSKLAGNVLTSAIEEQEKLIDGLGSAIVTALGRAIPKQVELRGRVKGDCDKMRLQIAVTPEMVASLNAVADAMHGTTVQAARVLMETVVTDQAWFIDIIVGPVKELLGLGPKSSSKSASGVRGGQRRASA